MSSVTKRADGSGSTAKWNPARKKWEVRVRLPDGKRITLRADTQREVEKLRETALDQVERGIKVLPERYTVSLLLDEWLDVLKTERTIKPATFVSYDSHVRLYLKPALGSISLKQLTSGEIRKRLVTAQLKAGKSLALVKKMRDILRIALTYAVAMDYIEANPASDRKVTISVPDNSRFGKAMSHADALRLLEVAAPQRNGPLFHLLVLTGLRLGEALGLRWSDVDWQRQLLNVEFNLSRDSWGRILDEPDAPEWVLDDPKTAKSKRTVPLVGKALNVLRTQQDRQAFERSKAREMWHDELDFIFTNEIGQPLADRGVQDAFDRALDVAGLDSSYRIHDLRHTANTYLYKLGLPQPLVMEIIGHTTLAMTQRYAHTDDEMLEEARAKLDALWDDIDEQHS